MCGRIATSFEWRDVEDEFDPDKILAEFSPRYNVAPSQDIPVIVAGSTAFDMYKWGLVPHWARDASSAMINARVESAFEKPFFRDAFTNFRCLVLVSGFFEWDKGKIPHYIGLKGKKLFALAGIANIYKSKDKPDESIKTVCILTQDANSFMKPIHHRMPIIIEKENYWNWIDPNNKNIEYLMDLLSPVESKKMIEYAVSKAVNSPKNDNSEILKKATKQSTL